MTFLLIYLIDIKTDGLGLRMNRYIKAFFIKSTRQICGAVVEGISTNHRPEIDGFDIIFLGFGDNFMINSP